MTADNIQRLLAEAERARRAGSHDGARKHLEAVLAIDGGEPTARNLLGADALGRSDARSAAEHLEIACRSEPGQPAH